MMLTLYFVMWIWDWDLSVIRNLRSREGFPYASAITEPSGRFSTKPVSPSFFASLLAVKRKPTNCTSP